MYYNKNYLFSKTNNVSVNLQAKQLKLLSAVSLSCHWKPLFQFFGLMTQCLAIRNNSVV